MLHSVISRRPWLRRLGPAAMLALALAATPGASAQGTQGALPDPITTAELTSYGNRLNLSAQQRLAVQTFHEGYLADYRALREGPIEAFIEQSGGRVGGMGAMLADPDAMKKTLGQLRDLNQRIQTMDTRFFDQMTGLLSDEQIVVLPRVKQARQRQRDRSGVTQFVRFANRAAFLDVSEIAAESNLAADARRAADTILLPYERRLTDEIASLSKRTNEMPMEFAKRLEEMGLSSDAMSDPEQRGRLFEAFRTIFAEINDEISERASEIADLNRTTVRGLNVMLSEDDARDIRQRYYQRAYREAQPTRNAAERHYGVALQLELPDAVRQDVLSARTAYRSTADSITEQMIDLVEERRRNRRFLERNEGQDSFEEELRSLRNQRDAVNESAITALRSILGEELAGAVDQRVASGREDEEGESRFAVALSGPGGDAATSPVLALQERRERIDQFVPGPIEPRDLRRYADRLDLDAEMMPVLEALHDEYRESYRTLEDGPIKTVRELRATRRGRDEGGMTVDEVDRLYDARRAALSAVAAIDGSFFEDLALTLGEDSGSPAMERIRLARERARYGAGDAGRNGNARGDRGRRGGRGGFGAGFNFGGGDTIEYAVDVAAIVDDAALSPQELQAVDTPLLDYERRATTAFRKSFEVDMSFQQALDRMRAEARESQEEEGGRGRRFRGFGEGMQELIAREGAAVRESRQTLTALNRGVLETVSGLLPDAAARRVRTGYNRAAYPSVYADGISAEDQLEAALRLGDLTSAQRAALSDMAMTYHTTWEEYSRQMIAVYEATSNTETGDPRGDWQSRRERQRNLERLRFDRDELSQKTLAKLRALLSEDQILRIGGLPETDGSES